MNIGREAADFERPIKMGYQRKLKFAIFRTSTRKWETIFEEASAFASKVGEENIANITTSCDHSDSLVTVWYWE